MLTKLHFLREKIEEIYVFLGFAYTLLLYSLEKETKKKMQRKFYGTPTSEMKTKFFRTQRNRMALQGRLKINWKICQREKATAEYARYEKKKQKIIKSARKKKSLKASLLLLWHAIVSDHFSSSFSPKKKSHQWKPEVLGGEVERERERERVRDARCVVVEDAICSGLFSGVINWLISNKNGMP